MVVIIVPLDSWDALTYDKVSLVYRKQALKKLKQAYLSII
jgi:hypothetical protein